MLKYVECPRDAVQGWEHFIPTEQKITYINSLLNVGFDTIDFGSFVSPKAIPQMADTKEVLKGLKLERTTSKLLAIAANKRGVDDAVVFDEINIVGYPFSVSETFQKRNSNATIAESFVQLNDIIETTDKHKKELVVYLSMGFGNPYGDLYHEDIVLQWAEKLVQSGISIISLADTVGLANEEQVYSMTKQLIQSFPNIEVGVHLHSMPDNWKPKIDAALASGCLRIDGAMKGIGGCPMAGNALVGNMNTEQLIPYFMEKGLILNIDENALSIAATQASNLFV
jgi:hydroxymethylglutaryl-CoA lyase